jgi:hypothetical protein
MTAPAIVLFGDVVDSRLDGPASARWLRSLAAELDDAYGEQCLAPFGFTQGDELQGVLDPEADPLIAVLRVNLRDDPAPDMRWAIASPARWSRARGRPPSGPDRRSLPPVS